MRGSYCQAALIDLPRFAETVRGHWAIENGQRWVLGVQFCEDARRVRKNHAPGNLALVRRMALNVIRHNGPSTYRLRTRKMYVALNDDYRFELIFGKAPA